MFEDKPGSWFSFKSAIEDLIGLFIIVCLMILGTGLFLGTLIGVIKFVKWSGG